MTIAQVVAAVRSVGLVAVWDRTWMEWRVNYVPGDPRRTKESSYHTTSRQDAIDTARWMSTVSKSTNNQSGVI